VNETEALTAALASALRRRNHADKTKETVHTSGMPGADV